MDAERRREVDLVVVRRVRRVAWRREVPKEDALSGCDEVQARDGGAPRDDGWRTRDTLVQRRVPAGQRERCGRARRVIRIRRRGNAFLLFSLVDADGCRRARAEAACAERILLVLRHHFARTPCAPLRADAAIASCASQPDNRAVDRAATAGVVPVLRPVVLDRST